jgi:hypothetical protein
MSDPQVPQDTANVSAEDMRSALFAQLVMQQSNMALMLLGKVPHPESGQVVKDLEAAKLFIDTLEMLEARTKGNLSQEEGTLLKQSLMSLRMAFVEAVEAPPPPAAPAPQAGASPAQQAAAPAAGGAAAAEEEHHKKFSKKY